jgi:hypothetical protein
MTIAISLKVNDGVVLASDSASTLFSIMPGGPINVANVYNNANKISNLIKKLPIGIIHWGSGSIGLESISTLIKDLRSDISKAQQQKSGEWHVNADAYQILEVAKIVQRFMYDTKYKQTYNQGFGPALGFIVAGYSTGSHFAEEYSIEMDASGCRGPILLRPIGESGMAWRGQVDLISRMVLGCPGNLQLYLQQVLKLEPQLCDKIVASIQKDLSAPLINAAMPIQDAIDLANFLVESTIQFSRFMPGAPTVGGPVDIAVITKHENFKWVKRKHYYSQEFNITVTDHE